MNTRLIKLATKNNNPLLAVYLCLKANEENNQSVYLPNARETAQQFGISEQTFNGHLAILKNNNAYMPVNAFFGTVLRFPDSSSSNSSTDNSPVWLGYEDDAGIDTRIEAATANGMMLHREVRYTDADGTEIAEWYAATHSWVTAYKASGGLWY